MIYSRLVCTALLCAMATGAYAQGQDAHNPSQQRQNDHRDTAFRPTPQQVRDRNALDVDLNKRRLEARPISNAWFRPQSVLTVRDELAKEWQRLGVPADQAAAIAAAYSGRPVKHEALDGKGAEAIADMLQGALAANDYGLANQLLIDYERGKLQAE